MDSRPPGSRWRPSPRTVFAQQFAALFEAAGNPTLRRVAAAAEARMRGTRAAGQKGGASVQRISDWKAGRNVPARFESLLPVLLTLIAEARKSSKPVPPALLDVQEWQRLWHASNAWDPDTESTECPYLGLTSYRRQDADLFFGRARPTTELTELIRDTTGPEGHGGLVMLVGASGAGKSSLLHAGLLPALVDPADQWAVATLTPGASPVHALLTAIGADCVSHTESAGQIGMATGSGSAVGDPGVEAAALVDHCAASAEFVAAELASWGAGRRRVVIVDQFEELFTLCRDDAQREIFLGALEHMAIRGEREPAAVVAAVRADFYARCLDVPVLEDALKHRSYLLGPMRLDELAEAIARPAELAGYKLESGLEELVVSELCGLGGRGERRGYDPGALPLVSHVMEAVWQRRDGTRLTIDGYQRAGGVLGSVAATAERAWNQLSEFEQSVGKQVLLGLVTVGDDSRDTRRKVARAELIRQTVQAAEAALDAMARSRLVTLDADSAYLTHEIVLDAWPRLRSWIDEDRVGYLERQRLQADASDWTAHGRDPSLLYRGARLTTMQGHADSGTIGTVAAEFLTAAQVARRHTERRTSVTRAALALLGGAALVLAGVALVQSGTAKQQRDNAIVTAVLAEADRLHDTDPSLSVQFTMAAARLRPGDPEIEARLLDSQSLSLAATVSGPAGRVTTVASRPDGRVLASSHDDGTVRLWDISDRRHPTALGQPLTGHTRRAVSVRFSPDGRMLASSSHDGTVRLWDIADPRRPVSIGAPLPAGPFAVVDISPDGRTLLTSDAGGGFWFWDIANPVRPQRLDLRLPDLPQGDRTANLVPAFSRDWHRMAVADLRGSVQIWDITDLRSSRLVGQLPGPRSAVEFSPDGRRLAVATGETLQLWDVSDASDPRKLGKPVSVAQAQFGLPVAFSPDGGRLAAAVGSGKSTVWSIVDPDDMPALDSQVSGNRGDTTTVMFLPDGQLVTGGADGRIHLWSSPRGDSEASTFAAAPIFDAGGNTSVTVNGRTVEIWRGGDVRARRLAGRFPIDHDISDITLSPDGRMIAMSAWDDSPTRLFDITDPAAVTPLAEFPQDGRTTRFASFSPDSKRLAILYAGGPSTRVRLWDLANRGLPRLIEEVSSAATDLRPHFVPEGDVLATSGGNDVTLWRSPPSGGSTRLGRIPTGRGIYITGPAFSPDGRTAAVTYDSRFVRIWDIADPARPVAIGDPLAGHAAGITAMAFAPDGRTLATLSEDSEIRLWDVSDRRHPVAVKASLGTSLSERPGYLAFDPTGKYLVTSGRAGTWWWDMNPRHAVDRICAVTSPRLDEQVWREHLPGIAYQPACI
ncbi:hypothetical protein [Nocardia sp. NPDC052566]|uniref:NACHT and WD repeat domain-containing protein n=1 Tax=Nocardia sp. NPDC052566 TaxID=3364330 RepID=UPI0037C69B5F